MTHPSVRIYNALASKEFATPEAQRIFLSLLPEWADHFEKKNSAYGATHGELGLRGCFPDLWKKVAKLKTALWEGQPITGEQPPELLRDLIGHCFLIWTLYNQERPARRPVEVKIVGREENWESLLTIPGPLPAEDDGDDGWSLLPDEVQEALRVIAKNGDGFQDAQKIVRDFVEERGIDVG